MNTNTNTNINTKTSNDWSKREIGALWKKEGTNQKFLSGYVKVDELGLEKEIKVVVFANKNKSKDTAPDYRIYVSKPLNSVSSAQDDQKEIKAVITKKVVVPKKEEVEEVVEDDSIL